MSYKLEELARHAGVSARTVRYYVQRGLLPPPAFRGKDSAYEDEHLVRLRAIRRLQDVFLPLDAIAAEFEGKSLDKIERLGKAASPVAVGAAAPRTVGRVLPRVELAEGVELIFAEDCPAASRALVEKILQETKS